MIYQKKSTFFRRLTSKMVNARRQSEQKRNSSQIHADNQDRKNRAQECPFLEIIPKDLPYSHDNEQKDCVQPVQEQASKEPRNSLLAAKLKCDEWGMHSPKPVSKTAKKITIPSDVVDASLSSSGCTKTKTLSVRINKTQHPSYKPASSRHRSMKERREAKEQARKFKNFYSSLSRIDEVDEKGIE